MRTREPRHDGPGDGPAAARPRPGDGLPLSELLDRWVADGVITPEQAGRMLRTPGIRATGDVRVDAGRPQHGSLVVEALGYLGGVIVVVASMLVAARYWGDLATAWRLTVLGSAACALLVAGAVVPGRLAGVGDRLRSALWLASTAAGVGFLAVLAADGLGLDGDDATLLVASGVSAYALGLWLRRPSPVQQVAMMAAFAFAASALLARTGVDDLPGLGAWAVGLAWALLGRAGVMTPGRLAVALGSATAIVGAMLTAGSDAGTVLTLVTVTAVVAAATALRDLALLGVGTLGLLVNLPGAITRWFPDSLAAPYALLVMGALLVVLAVRIARRPPAG